MSSHICIPVYIIYILTWYIYRTAPTPSKHHHNQEQRIDQSINNVCKVNEIKLDNSWPPCKILGYFMNNMLCMHDLCMMYSYYVCRRRIMHHAESKQSSCHPNTSSPTTKQTNETPHNTPHTITPSAARSDGCLYASNTSISMCKFCISDHEGGRQTDIDRRLQHTHTQTRAARACTSHTYYYFIT